MKRIIFLFLILSFASFSNLKKIDTIEKKTFGFIINNETRYEDRLSNLEKKIIGKENIGDIYKRTNDLNSLLFINGRKICLEDKINYLFSIVYKNENDYSLLSKVEYLEEEIFKRIFNNYSLVKRVELISEYFKIDFNDNTLKQKLMRKEKINFNVDSFEIVLDKKQNYNVIGNEVQFKIDSSSNKNLKDGYLLIGNVIKREDKKFFIIREKYIIEFNRVIKNNGDTINTNFKAKFSAASLRKRKSIKLENINFYYYK